MTAFVQPGILSRVRTRIARRQLPDIVRRIKDRNLTYLSLAKFASLQREIRRLQRQRIAGDFVEFGVALGGSAVFLAHSAGDRRFAGYDVFEMIPPPSERDGDDTHRRYEIIRTGMSGGIGGDPYYGYEDGLYDKVVATFESFSLPVDGNRISLKKGLFEDTVSFGPDERVGLAHIDCDWYDPVKFCIEAISPILSPGGVIVLDDYNDYGGCRAAVDDALQSDASLKMLRTEPHGVLQKL